MVPTIALKEITATFLESTIDYKKNFNAARELKALFYEIAEFNPDSDENRENLPTINGNALGPLWAAMCIDDFMRTKIFLTGIHEAILNKLVENKRPVNILYAGSGPFATLVTPLTTCFTKEQLQITCIEVNPLNIIYLNKVIKAFNIQGYFKDIYNTDATTFAFSTPDEYDIILTETMLASLRKEPQVAISLHLCSQAAPSTSLIPEEIIVSFAFQNTRLSKSQLSEDQLETPNTNIIPLLKLNKETRNIDQLQLEKKIEVDHSAPKDFQLAVLLTKIKIFGNHIIPYKQSGLTLPVNLTERFKDGKTLMAFNYRYQLGEMPGLKFEFQYD